MKRNFIFLFYLFVCAFLWRGLCAMSVLKMLINKSCLQISGFSSYYFMSGVQIRGCFFLFVFFFPVISSSLKLKEAFTGVFSNIIYSTCIF